MSSKVSSKTGGSSSSTKRKSGKQAPIRLPFHPRRSTRKPPPLELEAERFSTLPVDTDVLELATSPILDYDGLTPPPTSSPKPAGAVFRWPVGEEEAPPPPPLAKPLAKPLTKPRVQPPGQPPVQPPSVQPPPVQPAPVQPPPMQPAPVQPPPMQPPPVQPPPVQPAPVQPSATTKRAQPRATKGPVRPLTPTVYEVLDSDEEEPEHRRMRFDEGIQRQVPRTPGWRIDAAEYDPPPPPPPSPASPPPPPPPAPPSRWQEMVGIAWPAEVAQEARRLVKGGRRRTHLVWCGGRRYQVKASRGRARVFRDQQQQQ